MAKEPIPPPTKKVRNVRLTEVVLSPEKSELTALAEAVSPKKPATIVKPKPPLTAPPPKK